jgi:hypothetical protein
MLTKISATDYNTTWQTPFSQTTADGRYLALTGGTLTGSLLFSADNAYNIGADGAMRAHNLYLGGSISLGNASWIYGMPSGGQPLIRKTNFGYGSGTYRAVQLGDGASITLGVDTSAIAGGQFYGNNELVIPNVFHISQANSGGADFLMGVMTLNNGAAAFSGALSTGGSITNGGHLLLSGGIQFWSNTWLVSESANNIALQGSSQIFRIYNAYTNSSNFERLAIGFAGNNAYILGEQAGTGVGRDMVIQPSNALYLGAGGALRWVIGTSVLQPMTDNAIDIGASAGRVRYLYIAGGILGPAPLRLGIDGVGWMWQVASTGYFVPSVDNAYDIGDYSGNRPRLVNVASGIVPSTGASAVRGGSGAPSAAVGSDGDFYFRKDTPTTANQRIYIRSAGAWVGIV